MGVDLARGRYGYAGHTARTRGLSVTAPSRVRRPADTAKRSIHFFRIDGGAGDDGAPIAIDLRPALQKLDGLPFRYAGEGGRYVTSGTADQCVWVDRVSDVCELRFANVRRNALPQAEADGHLSDLDLADNAGICEVSHLCVFPDGIVGVEFNFYGPRPSRLAPYLQRVVGGDCPEFALEALLRQDVAAVLQRKKAIRKLDLNIRRPYISVVEEANASLGAEDRTEEIDLLRDELIAQKKVLRQHGRTRVLLSTDAYAQIINAHTEGLDELTAAASVRVAGG